MKKLTFQFGVAIMLFCFPVLMLWYNGNRALKGITWNMPTELIGLKSISSPSNSAGLPTTDPREKAPLFGVYDPENAFAGDTSMALEQVYLSWIDFNDSAMQSKIENIYLRGRNPVITIEPWNGPNDAGTLLEDIPGGKYDENISRIIRMLSGFKGKMYVSWGHEMDQDLTKRYPWSGSDPAQYIAAYHYVAKKLDFGSGGEITWIWSPVGKKGCDRYWPGDEYVDLIGLPIYSYPAWDKSYYGYIRSFKSWYEEKYSLVSQLNKPVIIVEMGVTGSLDYQIFWLQEAFKDFKVFTSIEAVIFFHAQDTPGSWGENMATPDWRTQPAIINGFINWIRAEY